MRRSIHEEINFDIVGKGIILFDKETRKQICLGSVKVVNSK